MIAPKTADEIIDIAARLKLFNDWRRGADDIQQPEPNQLGRDIDAAVALLADLAISDFGDGELER